MFQVLFLGYGTRKKGVPIVFINELEIQILHVHRIFAF